jgi:hypothetical protein
MVLRKLLVAFSLTLALAVPRQVMALDRDAKSVITGGAYGLLGGTVVGLLSYPLTRDARSIAIGSSVGLYLGIVVGAYNAIDRDSPGNPLKAEDDVPKTPGISDLRLPPQSSRADLAQSQPEAIKQGKKSGPPALLELNFPVARF